VLVGTDWVLALPPSRLKPFTSLTQKVTLSSKKRTQEEAAAVSSSLDEVTDPGDLGTSEGEEEFISRPKRRSVEVRCSYDRRASLDRRTSLDKWHAARRMR
jgi:hypothetical protein